MKIKINLLVISLITVFSVSSHGAVPGFFPQKRMSITKEDMGLKQALVMVLKKSNKKYSLSSNITDLDRINLKVKNMKLLDVFYVLVVKGRLSYSIDNDSLVIEKHD